MANTTTVRASERAHAILQRTSEQDGISMVQALDRITSAWEKMQFFETFNGAFAALRSDTDAWREELDERRQWDHSLGDDLDHDEVEKSEPG